MPTAPKRIGGPAKKNKYSNPSWKHSPDCYGWDWVQLRNSYKAKHVLCEECLKEKRTTLADCVHHKIPFKDKNDPLRLDWDNLESVCNSCHSKLQHKARKQG